MPRKVFVVYADYGSYEGCREPIAVFEARGSATTFIYDTTEHWRDRAKIIELELNP